MGGRPILITKIIWPSLPHSVTVHLWTVPGGAPPRVEHGRMGVSLLQQLVEVGVTLRLLLIPGLHVVSHVVFKVRVEAVRKGELWR